MFKKILLLQRFGSFIEYDYIDHYQENVCAKIEIIHGLFKRYTFV